MRKREVVVIKAMRPNFFHHLHPPTIPAVQSRWRYTLGAGGTAVFLVLVLVVTGVLEMFFYIPTPAEAALSIQTLTYSVPFGGLLRNLHFWSAQLLLVVSVIHLVRVVFTGSYAPPRRFNYLLGLALFVFAILLDFTGYILRWDQGIQWALVVGTNLVRSIPWVGSSLYQILVGGVQPGSATLIRFYAWHIFGLTLLATVVMVWHIFRVRRDGGIAVPPPRLRAETERISRFELVRREVAAMLLSGAALLLLSVFYPAPIAPAMTEITAPSIEARAPWFFLWVQQMLKWGDPFLWGVLIPLLILLILALIPYIFHQPAEGELGRWFPRSNRLAQVVLAVIAFLVLLFTFLALGSMV
jgi:quinol-cytochrome oxidoreductase complex cytochrome b subunit